jgi:ubiquinol-cytochrome c reductase cytochrome b subunit
LSSKGPSERIRNLRGKVIEHLALEGIVARLRDLHVPSDTLTWTRFLGFGYLALVLVVLLFASGLFMSFYYTPAPGAAYDSVRFAQYHVVFGDVVRGIHYYAWNLLMVVLGLHMTRNFLVASYKAPRQFVWVSGVLILLFMPLFLITGDLLPWDQKGYWTTQVRASIISSVPIVGDFMAHLLRGGPNVGVVAMTRFYALHILFLPAVIVFLIAVHFHLLWNRGLTDSPGRKGHRRHRVPFFPALAGRFALLFLLTTIALGLFAYQWPAPLGDPADPTDANYVPKPEWWVLFLNQLVTIFNGPYSIIGTVIIPGGFASLLLFLPFIDRSPERKAARRIKTLAIAAAIALFLGALSAIGYYTHFIKSNV